MKKAIVLVGLVLSFGVHAKVTEKTMVEDYIPVADRDSAYEIKTKVFDKVILDCGGIAGWMTFYRNEKIVHNVYLDEYGDCPNMHQYLLHAKDNKVPVCLQVEGPADKSSLNVSNDPSDCQ